MSLFSGNTLRQWTSKLLARDTVFRAVQQGLHSSLDARRAVDRNAERVWSLLDVPSRREIERLKEDIDELDETLAEIQQRLNRLRSGVQRSSK